MAPASNVLDTAISVTDARSRRASLQARAISCSTVESAFGKDGVITRGFSGAMSAIGGKFTGSFEFYQIRERLLEPFSLASRVGPGGKDVTRYFQPQKSETQEASRNPRAACIAGADPGDALDAGTRPFARGGPRQAARADLPRIRPPRPAQRRGPARSRLLGRSHPEIGGLYSRLLRRRRPQLRHPARQPAGQPAVDPHPAVCRRGRTGAMLDQQYVRRSRPQ